MLFGFVLVSPWCSSSAKSAGSGCVAISSGRRICEASRSLLSAFSVAVCLVRDGALLFWICACFCEVGLAGCWGMLARALPGMFAKVVFARWTLWLLSRGWSCLLTFAATLVVDCGLCAERVCVYVCVC